MKPSRNKVIFFRHCPDPPIGFLDSFQGSGLSASGHGRQFHICNRVIGHDMDLTGGKPFHDLPQDLPVMIDKISQVVSEQPSIRVFNCWKRI